MPLENRQLFDGRKSGRELRPALRAVTAAPSEFSLLRLNGLLRWRRHDAVFVNRLAFAMLAQHERRDLEHLLGPDDRAPRGHPAVERALGHERENFGRAPAVQPD